MAQHHFVVGIPAAGGGDREHHHDKGQDHGAEHTEVMGEYIQRQGGVGGTTGPLAGNQHGEGGDGADHEGVHKHLKGAPQTLLYRVAGLAGGVDHGAAAPAGLVGVYAAGHTGGDHLGYTGTREAAQRGRAGEGLAEDGAQGGQQVFQMHEDNDDAQDQVGQAHDGNQLGEDLAQLFHAAPDHEVQNQHDDQRCDGLGNAQRLGHHLRGGEGGSADEEGGEDADAEHKGQRQPQLAPVTLLAKAPLHIIGGAAVGHAVFIGAAVVHRQGHLHLLDEHTQEGGEPHPEHRTGAAGGHSGGHARDVAEAHRAAHGGGDGFVGGEQALFIGALIGAVEQPAQGTAENVAQVPHLEELGTQGEVHAGDDHQDNQRRAPDDVVQGVQNVRHDVVISPLYSIGYHHNHPSRPTDAANK